MVCRSDGAGLDGPAGVCVGADGTGRNELDRRFADSNCYLRGVHFAADGEAMIDFGSDDFDFGFWYYFEEGQVIHIDFEFYYDTFLGRFDGTYIRIAHAYTFSDEIAPHIELCTLYRD